MKLRCTENSIRIRIRKSELDQLAQTKRVEEKVRFGSQVVLTFALSINETMQQVAATLLDNNLVVSLPKSAASEWINSNQVGIEVNKEITDNESLHILIEKDFPCLDRENEDKSDTFWELASDSLSKVKPFCC